MKRILGLDLGTTSIGWALVNEAENKDEQSSIIKLGVRVNPLTVDESSNYEKGKAIETNQVRREKRGAHRNLQRYKQRRETLLSILKSKVSFPKRLCFLRMDPTQLMKPMPFVQRRLTSRFLLKSLLVCS